MANEICFVRGDTCDRYITSIIRRSDDDALRQRLIAFKQAIDNM